MNTHFGCSTTIDEMHILQNVEQSKAMPDNGVARAPSCSRTNAGHDELKSAKEALRVAEAYHSNCEIFNLRSLIGTNGGIEGHRLP